MFNDFASVSRDHTECNLNSLNFPEFSNSPEEQDEPQQGNETGKEEPGSRDSLLHLGEYHREASLRVLNNLVEEVRENTANMSDLQGDTQCKGLELFVHVTGLFADMYLAKDLTNSARQA